MQKLFTLFLCLLSGTLLFSNSITGQPFLAGPGISNPVPIAKFLDGNLPTTTPSETGGSPTAPALLSQTGAFANFTTLEPSPGVIPYDMIEPFWSDGAAKFRWMAIPNDGTHDTAAEQIGFSADGNWTFPAGAVLIKHFELGGQRLETRFEVLGDDGVYYYLTYKWNATQTDAELLLGALDETVLVNGNPQVWHYPSRAECQNCHLPQAGHVLGPKTRYLNKNITYPSTGIDANQLVTLSALGIITENITDTNSASYMAVAAKDDPNASLEYRARSYIDVNCSYCHQPGATNNGAFFDALITTPLEDQNIIYGPLLYDVGLDDPKVVTPQDVPNSMLHHRMNSLETGIAMPPLAKNVIDADGVQLIADWINSIEPSTSFPPVASFSASPVFGNAPLIVSFDASASFDPDEDPITYIWDFGDGGTATSFNPVYTYNTLGSYLVTLTVSDGIFTDITTTTITVNNNNPGTNTVAFTDATTLIMGTNFSGAPIAVSDMNADGRDDIIRLHQTRELNIQYQNEPGEMFTYVNFGSVSSAGQWSMCIADVDHNGYNDILTGGYNDGIKIIKNNNLNYVSGTIPNSTLFIQGSNFVDINNDGWSDVFACHDNGESKAFSNNQDGSFTFDEFLISTETTPFSDNSGNYASMWTDYDNDGDIDLYISKCRQGTTDPTDPRRINMLWQNDGNNSFTEVAAAANLKIGAQSWFSDFGDVDNDGDLDCFVVNHDTNCNLLLNNGDGSFTDVTNTSGLLPALNTSAGLGIQGVFRDFNNDGYIDIIYSGQNHFIFYNNGDGTFTEAPNPFNSNIIHSIAIGDLNHDGFLDVYAGYGVGFNGSSSIPDRLFLNDGNTNHFLNIQLRGIESNINGIGARVEAHGVWGKQIREVRAGEGYGIHNSFTQHFGLGQATTVDSIVIKWPSGIVQTIDDINAVDQFLPICELYGSICDDGNPATFNDSYDKNCICSGGTPQDVDGDGIFDNQDLCPDSAPGSVVDANGCVVGCTDNNAHNYISIAQVDDGSCETCNDGILNGDETSIDCGGMLCVPCCEMTCGMAQERPTDYMVGSHVVGANPQAWMTYPGFGAGPVNIVDAPSFCSSNSFFVQKSATNSDVIHKFDTEDAIIVSYKFNLYVPAGGGAYFTPQANLTTFTLTEQMLLDSLGNISLNNASDIIGSYTLNEWHQVEIVHNMENAQLFIYLDGNIILDKITNWHHLEGVNYWGGQGNFYFDNICINAVSSGCVDVLDLGAISADPDGTGWYAKSNITANGVVSNNHQLFQAGNNICLNAGFGIPVGKEFLTKIGPCFEPANDICNNAITLNTYPTCRPTMGSYENATASGTLPAPSCGVFGDGKDVWYKVIVPTSGNITVSVNQFNGSNDFTLQAYTGDCENLALIDCDDDGGPGFMPRLQLNGQAVDTTIFLRLFEFGNNAAGSFEICATEG